MKIVIAALVAATTLTAFVPAASARDHHRHCRHWTHRHHQLVCTRWS